MLGNRITRWVACLAVVLAVGLPQHAAAQQGRQDEQVQRQETQPLNNAPVWRDVRGGNINQYQTTQVRGVETNVLVESGGEVWRQIRNGPVTIYGGWLLVITFLLIGAYYAVKGSLKLHGKPSGRTLQRFSAWDRIVHWTTAVTFVILAITGLITLFGKHVLLPVTGYTLFSWLASLSKSLHNFVGPLFAVCTVLMIITYLKDNLPKAYDFLWVRKWGGMFSGEHVPSGRFNAGEKAWFWGFVMVLGIVVSATGFVLDFANFGQGRVLMQQMNVIHAIAGVLFTAGSLGHIYMGTIGVDGAYEAMRNGMVDETWAKDHHEYWYNDVKRRGAAAPGGAPSTAPASPVKEGWK
jgi:formate dehydrogenase subunit gamma